MDVEKSKDLDEGISEDGRFTVFIIEGERRGEMTPIAKLDSGKIVLFPTEYHQYITPGEVWECKVLKNEETYLMAHPMNKIVGTGQSETSYRRMPPVVSQVFVEALEKEIENIESELSIMQSDRDKLEEEYDRIQEEYRRVEEQYHSFDDRVHEKESKLSALKDALEVYTPQTVDFEEADMEDVYVGEDEQEEETEALEGTGQATYN